MTNNLPNLGPVASRAIAQSSTQTTIDRILFTVTDALLQAGVIDRDLINPSSFIPTKGDVYIVAASGATEDWLGRENKIAIFHDAWFFLTPRIGWSVWIEDEGHYIRFDGTSWVHKRSLKKIVIDSTDSPFSIDDKDGDLFIIANVSAGNITINLVDPPEDGRRVMIKNINGGKVFLDPDTSTIDGGVGIVTIKSGELFELRFDDTLDWIIV